MSLDLQVVFPQALVPLTGVRVLPGFAPATLDVLGDDFRAVDEVLINDRASPEVVVLSQTRLLAQIPAGLENAEIGSVVVVSNQLTVTRQSLLRLRIGKTPAKVRGILKLLQVFVKVLLTTPGTDIFSSSIGGGALRNLGLSFGRDQTSAIVNDIVIATNATQRQLIGIQSRDPSLPRDERLLAARVIQANYDQAQSSLNVIIEVTSQAGRAATANLTV